GPGFHQEDEGAERDVEQTEDKERSAPPEDSAETHPPRRYWNLELLAPAEDRVGVHRTRLLIAEIPEKQLVERPIAAAVEGHDPAAGTQSSGGAAAEDLGHEIGARVIHGPPAEIGAVRPPEEIRPVQGEDCEGEGQGKTVPDPVERSACGRRSARHQGLNTSGDLPTVSGSRDSAPVRVEVYTESRTIKSPAPATAWANTSP